MNYMNFKNVKYHISRQNMVSPCKYNTDDNEKIDKVFGT